MHRINNIDVKVIISEVCCAYILREYAHILAFLLKGMLLVIYHLWPLPDVWEQFSKSLPKIIVNNLQYFSAHVLSAPYFLLFFFFGIIIYVLVLEPPQRNYAVFTFKKSYPALLSLPLREGKNSP